MKIGHVLGPITDEDRELLNDLDTKGNILKDFNDSKIIEEDEVEKALDLSQMAIDNAIPAISGFIFYTIVKKYGGVFYEEGCFNTWQLSEDNAIMILIEKQLIEEEERFKFEMAYEMVETLKKVIVG